MSCSSHADLARRQGRYALNRFEFLQALVTEFQDTADEDTKAEILSHLGNFAYDPINYEWMRQLHIVDLFLDSITETNTKFVQFGSAGLCNCCIDPKNRSIIFEGGGISTLLSLLGSSDEETVLNALACLFFMATPADNCPVVLQQQLSRPSVHRCLTAFARVKTRPRLRNLATLFLQSLPAASSTKSDSSASTGSTCT